MSSWLKKLVVCTLLFPQIGFAFELPSPWKKYLEQELIIAKAPQNATRFEFKDLKRPTILFFHGIHDSITQYDEMRSQFSEFNWVRVRLAGHYDKSKTIHEVVAEDWLKQSKDMLKLVTDVTGPVYLIGHSLGGLLSTNLALKFPKLIKGLIIASPALGVSPIVAEVLRQYQEGHITPELMKVLDDLLRKNQEQLSPSAGLQVQILGKALLPENQKEQMYQNMKVPLFLINVTNDIAISGDEVQLLEDNYKGPLFFQRKVGLKQGYNHPSFQNAEKNLKLGIYQRIKVFINAIEYYL